MEPDTRTWTSHWGHGVVTMTVRRHDDHTIVEVSGDLDPYQECTLTEELTRLTAEGYGDLIVDLTCVDFLDPVSMGGLCRVQGHLQSQGRALRVVTREGGLVLKILRDTGMSKAFDIHTDGAAALTVAPRGGSHVRA
ncbi:STAS domain-containing protein [Embleya sp. MST-111070]|uniref:STAS domain-containing protein n=1 Tax=Embleya sp. MST-111070 TaxID=3398231 RepID=UPI003F73676E